MLRPLLVRGDLAAFCRDMHRFGFRIYAVRDSQSNAVDTRARLRGDALAGNASATVVFERSLAVGGMRRVAVTASVCGAGGDVVALHALPSSPGGAKFETIHALPTGRAVMQLSFAPRIIGEAAGSLAGPPTSGRSTDIALLAVRSLTSVAVVAVWTSGRLSTATLRAEVVGIADLDDVGGDQGALGRLTDAQWAPRQPRLLLATETGWLLEIDAGGALEACWGAIAAETLSGAAIPATASVGGWAWCLRLRALAWTRVPGHEGHAGASGEAAPAADDARRGESALGWWAIGTACIWSIRFSVLRLIAAPC